MSAQLDEISRRLRQAVEVGESVILSNHREGIVRYKGQLDGKSGIFYGIELSKGTGKNDGVYKGKTRYFTCERLKGIFVDKKQILYKKQDYILKKRASLSIRPQEIVIYHCEFMKRMYGIWHRKKGVDPIDIVLRNSWDEYASKTTNWKERWQLLKELMKVVCGDEYGKFDLPARFIYNPHHDKVLMHLVDWLKNEKHLGLRKHILKILVPFSKTYEIKETYANILAKSLIQKQWKETKYGFRATVTRALLAVYYASNCTLEDWMPWLYRCLQSRSDVRIQAWNFLSDIALLAANPRNTAKKQKALLDIEMLLCDGKIIQLFKSTLANDAAKTRKIMIACAEFIFGAKYILPDMKSIHGVYSEVKENRMFMKDEAINEYCQLLVKGDNAFDLFKSEVETIERRKEWEEGKIKCDFCPKHIEDLTILNAKIESARHEIENIKDTVNGLRMQNATQQQDIEKLKAEVMNTDKRTELITDDMKDIEIEILQIKNQIYRLQTKKNVDDEHKSQSEDIDLTNWEQWNYDDILQWILSLENGMYAKYKTKLKDIFPMEAIRGNDLHMMNERDLISFGINDVNDSKRLVQHIQDLTSNQSSAPIPFSLDVDLSLQLPIAYAPSINNGQREGMINDK